MKKGLQITWLVVGLFAIILLSLGINTILTIRHEVKAISKQITMQDVRQAMNIIEKQIDTDLFTQMTYRGYITDQLVEWTPENWEAFLDFSKKNGYFITDDNWQDYIHGKLKPLTIGSGDEGSPETPPPSEAMKP